MPITAGTISISRRINTGDYSHKEAKVELHYTAEGGEKIGDLGDMARVEALTQLSTILATVVKVEHTPAIVIDEKIAQTIEPKVENRGLDEVVETGKRRRRTKAEMDAARTVDAAALSAGDADPAMLFPVGVPPTAPALGAMEGASTKTAAGEANESWAHEITDKALNNYCNETMLRIKNKAKIQGVIAEYTEGPVSTIPQLSRAMFMQKLQALQP